jgi:hypothetical protein
LYYQIASRGDGVLGHTISKDLVLVDEAEILSDGLLAATILHERLHADELASRKETAFYNRLASVFRYGGHSPFITDVSDQYEMFYSRRENFLALPRRPERPFPSLPDISNRPWKKTQNIGR